MKAITIACFFSLILLIVASCKGPEGDPGPKGDPGVTGEKGDTGAIGPRGADGASDTTMKARVFRLSPGEIKDGFYSFHLTNLTKSDYEFFQNSTVQVYFKTFGFWNNVPGLINFWEANADVDFSWYLAPEYKSGADFEVGIFAVSKDEPGIETLSFDEMRIVVTPGVFYNVRIGRMPYEELVRELNVSESDVIVL